MTLALIGLLIVVLCAVATIASGGAFAVILVSVVVIVGFILVTGLGISRIGGLKHEARPPEARPPGTEPVEEATGPVLYDVGPGPRPLEPSDLPGDLAPEDLPGEIGAEGGSQSPNYRTPTPFYPTKDDTPLGDTDQHSNA